MDLPAAACFEYEIKEGVSHEKEDMDSNHDRCSIGNSVDPDSNRGI